MRVNEFISIVEKIKRFKARLMQEGIVGDQQQLILKIYIQDLTSRINTDLLKAI